MVYMVIYTIYTYIYGHTDDIHTPKNYTKLHHFHTLKKSQADFDAHFNLIRFENDKKKIIIIIVL